ncbi:hypothetical protein EZV62_023475 [Acer yangbiense]|uniref:Integrase catalytic domain-containing protein n=1 Tax=Acer yangbiense TaxID=1000413 RepID=A0A5C7H266_9ROSI|nr:hypothetical protein EZV62_023475 [Acer yangbiense]
MQLLFEYQELWTVVSEGIVRLADAVTTRKDLKARFFINQSLDPVIFEKIAYTTSAKRAWDVLMNIYKGVEKVKKVRLQTMRRQLELLQMKKTEKVADYFSRTLALVNQMKSNGVNDLEEMTLDELMGSLQAHEQRLDEKSVTEVEEALQIQLSLKKDKDETQKNSEASQKGQNSCKRYGHYKNECKSNGRNFQANVAEDGDYSETLLLACNVAVDDAKYKWFLDTGCSNHMCGRKEMFSELDETFTSKMKFGNNSKVPVMGKGKISISLKDGSKNTISEVLFVPSLQQNMLSVGQLLEKGYDMRIYREVCTINDEQKGLIAKSLKLLSSRKMVSGLPVIDPLDRVCETCVVGKKHRDPFPIKKTWRASWPLELVHSDLYSVETSSNGGYRYFITFIDDFSRKAWVYFLQQKSDACDAFKRFKALVENQSERKKLDDKAEKCIFIGYSQVTKGYKLYNPVTEKVIVSRDITFDEQGCWDWSCSKGSSSYIDVDLDEIDGHPRDDPVPTLVAPPSPVNPHPVESSCRPQRERVLSARLQDCVLNSDDDPTDEELVNFALFADCDLITYEDAAHS